MHGQNHIKEIYNFSEPRNNIPFAEAEIIGLNITVFWNMTGVPPLRVQALALKLEASCMGKDRNARLHLMSCS